MMVRWMMDVVCMMDGCMDVGFMMNSWRDAWMVG